MRLQTFLSKAGICSRRAAKNIIASGKVHVNGKSILEASFKVDPERDKILLGRKKILLREKIYIMLHKPKGVTATKKDRFAERTVMDLLPRKFSHLNPVGRLDKDTTGLLLVTNDGDLINRLTHPRFNVEKTYSVKLDRILSLKDKRTLEKGVRLSGKCTAPCTIVQKHAANLEVTLHEGRKRQIKRMFSKVGYRLLALERLTEGALSLGALSEGKWRFLSEAELFMLKDRI